MEISYNNWIIFYRIYLSIYALLIIWPYIVKVKSFTARHEQQFSILQDFASLNYPEFIYAGKWALLFPI